MPRLVRLSARCTRPVLRRVPLRTSIRPTRLGPFGTPEFAVGERALRDAIVQAQLLVEVALHVGLRDVRSQRIRIAGSRVVFLSVDRAALAVLLVLDLRTFGGRERTVA